MADCDVLEYLRAVDALRALDSILASRRLLDPHDPSFGLTPRTERLALAREYDEGNKEQARILTKRPFVVMLVVPEAPTGMLISPKDQGIWDWLSVRQRTYPPDKTMAFLPHVPQATMGGMIMADAHCREPCSLRSYLAVEWCGIVELGLAYPVARIMSGELFFLLTPVVGRCWQLLGFVQDLYRHLSQTSPFTLVVGLRGTHGSVLGGFASGWGHPETDHPEEKCRCVEPAVLIRRHRLVSTLSDSQIEETIREVAIEMEASWGHGGPREPPRCYIHNHDAYSGMFDVGASQQRSV